MKGNRTPKRQSASEGHSGAQPVGVRTDSTPRNLLDTLLEGLREYWKSIAVASGAVIIGYVGFYASPLKEIVYHKIWQERVKVIPVVSSERIREDDDLSLKIIIFPESSVQLSEGVLSVDYPPDRLRMTTGSSTLSTPKIDAPMELPQNSQFGFVGLRPGVAEIRIDFRTKFGTYTATKTVEVENVEHSVDPSKSNFSGHWHIRIEVTNGVMDLLDRGGEISGSYRLDDGLKGGVYGLRDGVTLRVTLTRGSAPLVWKVESTWNQQQQLIYLTGTAHLLKPTESGWAPLDKDSSFDAVSKLAR
jgi:hypothetical protein